LIFVGDDWAEAGHDIEILDETGRRLARRRLPEGIAGIAALHALISDQLAADAEPAQVVIGIETDRGLWVAALVGAGYRVYAVNPLAVSRYRDRHTVSGANSDPGDAKVLADLVRTDRHNHRPIAGDSEQAEAIKLLARTHQNLIWTRQRQTNALRSALREFYPAALTAFGELACRDALAVLAIAATPTAGRALSRARIATTLRRAGRQRNINTRARDIQAALASQQLAAPPLIERSFGVTVAALVGVITAIAVQIEAVETQLGTDFDQHPDAEILRSLPGLGTVLGARVLGEFGDDPTRYPDPKARKNYAGTSPITRASGTRRVVLARVARNRRLADACHQWAFATLIASPGARRYYDTRRATGATHHQALRALGNRLVGILHGCLRHHQHYDETTTWQTNQQDQPAAA
jgi:transposase